jgi:hypothetical protein
MSCRISRLFWTCLANRVFQFDWMFLESFTFRHSVLEESKVFGGAFSPICLLQRLPVARRPALRPWQRDQHYHQVRIRRVLKFKVVIECCRISIVKHKSLEKVTYVIHSACHNSESDHNNHFQYDECLTRPWLEWLAVNFYLTKV